MEWFKMYTDWRFGIELLTDEEAGRLIKFICHFAVTGEAIELSGNEKLLAAIIVPAMTADIKKFNDAVIQQEKEKERQNQIREKRRLAGIKGAEAKWGKQYGE